MQAVGRLGAYGAVRARGERETPRTALVLLEGVSDVAAVRVLASARGVDPQRIDLVDMGGVTNVRHALTEATRRRPEADVVGLCDAGEAHFVIKALRAVGHPVSDASDLPAYGFFFCQSDLEDELIRALGTARTMAVVEKLGLSAKLATLRQQPAWQGRPLAHQLHRFCGVASGRKELLAGELAAALAPGEEPEPLRMLVARMPQGLATPSTAGERP